MCLSPKYQFVYSLSEYEKGREYTERRAGSAIVQGTQPPDRLCRIGNITYTIPIIIGKRVYNNVKYTSGGVSSEVSRELHLESMRYTKISGFRGKLLHHSKWH